MWFIRYGIAVICICLFSCALKFRFGRGSNLHEELYATVRSKLPDSCRTDGDCSFNYRCCGGRCLRCCSDDDCFGGRCAQNYCHDGRCYEGKKFIWPVEGGTIRPFSSLENFYFSPDENLLGVASDSMVVLFTVSGTAVEPATTVYFPGRKVSKIAIDAGVLFVETEDEGAGEVELNFVDVSLPRSPRRFPVLSASFIEWWNVDFPFLWISSNYILYLIDISRVAEPEIMSYGSVPCDVQDAIFKGREGRLLCRDGSLYGVDGKNRGWISIERIGSGEVESDQGWSAGWDKDGSMFIETADGERKVFSEISLRKFDRVVDFSVEGDELLVGYSGGGLVFATAFGSGFPVFRRIFSISKRVGRVVIVDRWFVVVDEDASDLLIIPKDEKKQKRVRFSYSSKTGCQITALSMAGFYGGIVVGDSCGTVKVLEISEDDRGQISVVFVSRVRFEKPIIDLKVDTDQHTVYVMSGEKVYSVYLEAPSSPSLMSDYNLSPLDGFSARSGLLVLYGKNGLKVVKLGQDYSIQSTHYMACESVVSAHTDGESVVFATTGGITILRFEGDENQEAFFQQVPAGVGSKIDFVRFSSGKAVVLTDGSLEIYRMVFPPLWLKYKEQLPKPYLSGVVEKEVEGKIAVLTDEKQGVIKLYSKGSGGVFVHHRDLIVGRPIVGFAILKRGVCFADANGSGGFIGFRGGRVVEIAPPFSPFEAVTGKNFRCWFVDRDGNILVYNFMDGNNPVVENMVSWFDLGKVQEVELDGSFLFAASNERIFIFDVSEPSALRLEGSVPSRNIDPERMIVGEDVGVLCGRAGSGSPVMEFLRRDHSHGWQEVGYYMLFGEFECRAIAEQGLVVRATAGCLKGNFVISLDCLKEEAEATAE